MTSRAPWLTIVLAIQYWSAGEPRLRSNDTTGAWLSRAVVVRASYTNAPLAALDGARLAGARSAWADMYTMKSVGPFAAARSTDASTLDCQSVAALTTVIAESAMRAERAVASRRFICRRPPVTCEPRGWDQTGIGAGPSQPL